MPGPSLSPCMSPSPPLAAAASRIQSGEKALALPFRVVVLPVLVAIPLPLSLEREALPEPRSLSPSLAILEKLRFLMADRWLPESSSSPMLRSFGSYRKGAELLASHCIASSAGASVGNRTTTDH